MANSIKVLFWLHRSKTNSNDEVPVMIRLSSQGRRTDKATGHYVLPEKWNSKKQRIKGENELDIEFNTWMDSIRVKVRSLEGSNKGTNPVHLPSLMDKLFPKVIEEKSLQQIITEHNEELKLRVNKDYSYSTYEKYVFTEQKVRNFITSILNKKDVLLKDLTVRFIMDFDHFLRVNENNQHNTAVKYCLNLKRIINNAVLKGYLEKNIFTQFKTVYKITPRVYLEENELNLIQKARLVKPNHLLVRDLFILQCLTGLSYTDMMSLKRTDFKTDNNLHSWIIKPRQKTGIISTIPILPAASAIIEKYSNSKDSKKPLLNGYSIQKYNQYLNEIGDLIGLQKTLSSHVGRRTFGNIALGRGVSLNVVSKILGHSSTLITQKIYAITTQEIIMKEIPKWS